MSNMIDLGGGGDMVVAAIPFRDSIIIVTTFGRVFKLEIDNATGATTLVEL